VTHRLILTVLTTLVAVVMAGCASPPQAAVEVQRPEAGPLPPQSFARQWTAELDLERDELIRLHVREQRLFAYTRGNTSYLLNRAGGHMEAIHPVRQTNLRAPIDLGNRVIYPARTSLEIFGEGGRRIRTVELPTAARSGAVALDHRVFIGLDYARGGRIASIDLTREWSMIEWERMTFGGVSAAPAVLGDTIYAGSEDGRLYAINVLGQAAWPLEGSYFQTDGRIVADIHADETGIYVASTDMKLYSLHPETGRIQWQYYSGAGLTSAPIVTRDVVYQQVPGIGLAAIDKQQGGFNREALWVSREAAQFLSQSDRHVFVRGRDNSIIALDRRTGERQFNSREQGFRIFGINPYDATIYAATADGQVVAVRAVLRPGTVGEMVLHLEPLEPVAMTN
jgi:hypothetical protein